MRQKQAGMARVKFDLHPAAYKVMAPMALKNSLLLNNLLPVKKSEKKTFTTRYQSKDETPTAKTPAPNGTNTNHWMNKLYQAFVFLPLLVQVFWQSGQAT